MGQFEVYKKELSAFEQKKSKYEWDELEELITDDFEEEKLTSIMATAASSKSIKEIRRSNQQPFNSQNRLLLPLDRYSLFCAALPAQSQLSMSGITIFSFQSFTSSSKGFPGDRKSVV